MENNIPLIDEINLITENKYEFSLKSASLMESADFCVLEILYRDGVLLSKQDKEAVEAKIMSIVPAKYKYEIKFIKNFINEQRIADDFSNFLKKTYCSIAFKLSSVMLENNTFTICFTVDNLSYPHAESKNLPKVSSEYLKSLYGNFEFECKMDKGEICKEDEEQLIKDNYREEDIDQSEFRKIEFFDIVPLVNEQFDAPASYIKDKTHIEENVVLCGKIKFIKEQIIKRKPKPESEETQEEAKIEDEPKEVAEDEADETKYQRKMYKWDLEDFTGTISCVFFSNKENQAKLEKLDAGSVIAVRGKIADDKYSGGYVMQVKDIAYCTLPENQDEVIIYHKEKPFYEFVKPEQVITYEQNNLLNFAEEKKVPKYLQNKTFVCYDLETTGLHFESGDKMIELGAVKIVNGKITEQFETLINPERPISAGASEVSGLTDADVKDSPKDYEVLGDFYKFKGDAILIGYNNINFDNVFLIGQGKNARWDFRGETEDVLNYARKYVFGVKNYKNSTVYEKLFGSKFDNAHRAYYDAKATAEVFIKICEIMETVQ